MTLINSQLCIGCGACQTACEVDAIQKNGYKYKINNKCTNCGNCKSLCPVNAIKFKNGEKK